MKMKGLMKEVTSKFKYNFSKINFKIKQSGIKDQVIYENERRKLHFEKREKGTFRNHRRI